MDSNVRQDVELPKKSCEKAREMLKSKRREALVLLASIGICLTLVVVAFTLGSLFGFYLANLQILPMEQNVVTVKEGIIEANHTIGGMQQLTNCKLSQIEQNIKTAKNSDTFQELVSQEPTTQEPVISETTTQEPITLRLQTKLNTIYTVFESRQIFFGQYPQFLNDIHHCPYKLALQCSGPALGVVLDAQRTEIKSIPSAYIKNNAQYVDSAQIEIVKSQISATIERISRTRVELCAGYDDDDYDECQSCVKRNANCFYSFDNFCNTQTEWNIIGYMPKIVDRKQCDE